VSKQDQVTKRAPSSPFDSRSVPPPGEHSHSENPPQMPRASKISASNSRGALAERTNIPIPHAPSTLKSWLAPPKRAQCKRQLDTVDRGNRKRVKLSCDTDSSDGSDAYESDSDPETQCATLCHRKNIIPWNLGAQRQPATSSRRPFCALLLSSLYHALLISRQYPRCQYCNPLCHPINQTCFAVNPSSSMDPFSHPHTLALIHIVSFLRRLRMCR
jgi:hypothetical protein